MNCGELTKTEQSESKIGSKQQVNEFFKKTFLIFLKIK